MFCMLSFGSVGLLTSMLFFPTMVELRVFACSTSLACYVMLLLIQRILDYKIDTVGGCGFMLKL